MNNFKFALGSKVKSSISGFEGIITSRSEHLNGCNRYWIQPKIVEKEMKLPDGYWFDEQELIVIKNKFKKEGNKDPGGFPNKIK